MVEAVSAVLFCDTETTSADPSTARMVQLAMLLHDDNRREVACASVIVDPGVDIPAGAAAIHGITNEIAIRFGITARGACGLFWRLLTVADLVVVYNMDFDVTVLCHEGERAKVPLVFGNKVTCAMAMASPICNMPPTERMIAAGFGDKPKSPKLSEAYRILLGKELVGAHDAMVDVRACAEIYYRLVDRKAGEKAA